MPNFYVISYDLKRPGQDYDTLYEAIKGLGDWQHPLESTWLVYTDHTANEISQTLRAEGRMDDSDLLFVCKLDPRTRQGWLARTVWEWFKSKEIVS